jgi:hypothetical protein
LLTHAPMKSSTPALNPPQRIACASFIVIQPESRFQFAIRPARPPSGD